jgi:hypothetical protein
MDIEASEDPLKDSKAKTVEDDEEEGAAVDYRRIFKGCKVLNLPFSDWSRKDKKKFQQIPKRGEKDFEPDGTMKQANVLQEGREAMYAALSVDAGLYIQSIYI